MRRPLRALLIAPALAIVLASPAAADPGGPFRRTTPRGALEADPAGLEVGIPGGRAWGAEGALLALDPQVGAVRLELAVDDPDISEAFVRVAYYARADRRSRQLATVDSPFVRVGTARRLVIELDPPEGAVAYRVRVLGRLRADATVSRSDAIRARWSGEASEPGLQRPSLTRLLTDRP